MPTHARESYSSSALWLSIAVALLIACGDDGAAGTADGPVATDATTDAATDAGIDAGGLCPGQLLFTGSYEDWDSTIAVFDGIEFTAVTQLEDPSNTATSAPNGRVIMCVPNGQDAHFSFVQPDYLDLEYTMSAAAQAMGAFGIRGLKPLRADDLFTLELGVTRDVLAAQVLVAVRTYPDTAAALGAGVSLGNGHVGAFTNDGTGLYVAGEQLVADAFVLFANVDVAGGTTTVSVSPPPGMSCVGPSEISLSPGIISATSFACTPL